MSQEVREWLRGLGLEKYAQRFADNDIDLATLPLLTDSHLAELGLPIGPRARLLAAVEALRSRSVVAAGSALDSVVVDSPLDPSDAERRQITILFADLADSTKLAARLDPEDLRTLMQQYQQACAQVIDHFGGHVAQYMGDGIMAYFGWPSGQEDAAERAVRAGLDLVAAITALRSAETLTVRVGINTGTVVISDTGHGDPSIPQAAAGAAPHIAARLQSLAAPNSVLISASTSRLVGSLCEQEPLGPQVLKGVAEPVPVFRVRQMHTRRFAASRAQALTPFVGRQAELALLMQRWQSANDGEGQLVYVSGVPGIGKSRIVHELEQRIAGAVHFRLRFQCSPHDAQSALHPIVHGLAWAAELRDDDAREVKLAKIRRLLELSTAHVDAAMPLWADLFSIPYAPAGARPPLSAQQKKDQTLFLLADVLVGLSRRGAVFCLLEDAHWIDPSTQELLELLAAHIESASVMFVVTHRPDYQPRIGERGNASTLAIARLSRRDMAEMARFALQAHATEQRVVQRILEQSDAIPLYVEELARGAIEAPTAAPAVSAAESRQGSVSSVPDSLRDALVARLDRAPRGRQIAQIAAVIGREFPRLLLQRVAQLDEAELDATLSSLIRSQILVLAEREPVVRYSFTHALLRDVAYESLLHSTSRELHAHVARALSEDSTGTQATRPELLAYHLDRAGDALGAVKHWIAGARLAHARWANREAIGQLHSAQRALAAHTPAAERNEPELDVTLLLGLCLITVEGYSSADARAAFERARTLSQTVGNPQRVMQALFGLWGHHWMAARHDRAIELSRDLLAQAQSMDSTHALAVAHRALGSTLFTQGEFVQAREHLQLAIALSSTDATPSAGTHFAVDPRIAAQLLLAWDLWFLGHPDQALTQVNDALARALANNDPYSSAFAHYVTSAVHLLRGEAAASLEHAERSHAISTEHRISLYALYSQFGRGCARASLQRHDAHGASNDQDPLDDIRGGIEAARQSGLGYMRAFMLGSLAQVLLERGDHAAAHLALDEAMQHVSDIAGRAWQAEIMRLRGDLLLAGIGTTGEHGEASGSPARPEPEQAAGCYRESIEVARSQRARSLELRTCTSLARLLASQGARADALALLAPIVDTFVEGERTADLLAARALLASLR